MPEPRVTPESKPEASDSAKAEAEALRLGKRLDTVEESRTGLATEIQFADLKTEWEKFQRQIMTGLVGFLIAIITILIAIVGWLLNILARVLLANTPGTPSIW